MSVDGGEEQSPFDVVFDDDFVKGASVKEAAHREREREAEKRLKAARKRGRKERNRHRMKLVRRLAVVAAVIAVIGLASFGRSGVGPLGEVLGPKDDATSAAPTTAGTVPGVGAGGTTTEPRVARRSYDRGACVTWDQEQGGTRQPQDVPCEEPHLMEMVSDVETTLDSAQFPSDREWDGEIVAKCLPAIEQYLGAPLDLQGRYSPAAIQPSPEGWDIGDHTMHCGIQNVDRVHVPNGRYAAAAGRVDPKAQQVLHPVGACLHKAGNYEVPCTQEHHHEVVGDIDLTGLIADVPVGANSQFWQGVAGARCRDLAATYLGRPLDEDENAGWISMESASWKAGAHVLQCIVGLPVAGEWEPYTGSLKD